MFPTHTSLGYLVCPINPTKDKLDNDAGPFKIVGQILGVIIKYQSNNKSAVVRSIVLYLLELRA